MDGLRTNMAAIYVYTHTLYVSVPSVTVTRARGEYNNNNICVRVRVRACVYEILDQTNYRCLNENGFFSFFYNANRGTSHRYANAAAP